MKANKRSLTAAVLLTLGIAAGLYGQSETLTNEDVILMTRSGLSTELIARKVKESIGRYKTSAQDLIELKKAGVSDKIIGLMMDSAAGKSPERETDQGFSDSGQYTLDTFYRKPVVKNPRIVLDIDEALANAKTVAIKKSSLHPSRQALEKELMKRKDWRELDLILVRHRANADLLIEIGYVSMSWITHRYVYRIYDNKSGTVIAAGETTSWGSLAKNLARGISKRMSKALRAER